MRSRMRTSKAEAGVKPPSPPRACGLSLLLLATVCAGCSDQASVGEVTTPTRAVQEADGQDGDGYARPDLLVDTVWLVEHLNDPTIRIVDTRPNGYQESHIPSAVHLDISTSRDASHPPTYLPSSEAFIEVIEAIGIGNDTRVIFYDDRGGVYGTRPWLVLRTLGHTQAAILDGGWDAWTREGRPTTSEVTEVARARFVPRPDDAWIVTAEDVRDAIDRPGTRIVDTRTVDELEGRDLRGAKRGGIIPSAIPIYWEETLDPELKTFKPASELRAFLPRTTSTPATRSSRTAKVGGARLTSSSSCTSSATIGSGCTLGPGMSGATGRTCRWRPGRT